MSDAKVELGCRLFFETRLSVTQAYSCASCHHPELAFTDGRALALGAKGDSMHRGAMTLGHVSLRRRRGTSQVAKESLAALGAHPGREND